MAIVAASAAHAEDIKTIGGVEYKDVTISRVEPDGLVLMTDAGIEKVAFDQLTKEAQEKYGYDPNKAAKFAASVSAGQMVLQQKAMADKAAARKKLEAATANSSTLTPAAPAANDANDAPKPIVKAFDKEGGMKKFVSLTVEQIATSPFSLERTMVKLGGISKIEPQEIAAGKYEITIYGAGTSILTAYVDQNTAALVERSKDLYVSVSEPKRHGSVITIHGNAARQEGLSVIPVVRWE